MKRFYAFALLVSASLALAEGPSVTLTNEIRSAYLLAPSVHGSGWISQEDVFLKWKRGFYFEFTQTTSLENPGLKSSDFGNETDFLVGIPLGKAGKAGTLEMGTYLLAPVTKNQNDLWTISWYKSFGPVTVTTQYLGQVGESSPPARGVLKVDYAKSVPLFERVKFVFPLRVGVDSGGGGRDSAIFARVIPKFVFTMKKGVDGFVGWEGTMPLTNRDDLDPQQGFRAGVKVVF
ncbi:MAG TPA: hypothetical protein VJJ24_02435 [Candidatus Paceibacterota bacterium]